MVEEGVPAGRPSAEDLEEECRRLREALVASETRFSVLFNHLLDGILLVDATSGKILMANRAAVDFFQRDRSELIGRHFSLMFPDERETDRRVILQKLRVHGHIFVEQQFVRKDGEVVWADLSAVMVKWDDDVAVVLSITDATERKAAEKEKLEAQRVQTRLDTITRLNHEINNPLQELLTFVELGGDDTIKEAILRIADVLKRQREQEAEFADEVPAAAPAHQEDESPDLEPADGESVLIVDDESSIRTCFRRAVLKHFPRFHVDVAGNGAEAIPLFKTKHHAIVVMDVDMPVMSGDEAFAELASICRDMRWQMPSVVFCTGFDLPPSIRSSIEASSRHRCLLKPVHMEALRDELVSCLSV